MGREGDRRKRNKLQSALHIILQSKKLGQRTGSQNKQNEAGTGMERYRKEKLWTALCPPPCPSMPPISVAFDLRKRAMFQLCID